MRPRVSDQLTSPTATSDGPSGVDRMASNVLGVLELEEEVEGRLHERPVHGRGGHEPGRHEGGVGDVAHVTDERPQAETDAQQVEDRLEEARNDDRPVAPVDQHIALEDLVGTPAAQRSGRNSRVVMSIVYSASFWPKVR